MRVSPTPNIARAVKVALLVGPILTLINQTPAVVRLFEGHAISGVTVIRIALTFLVPFAVSWYSSTMADRTRRRSGTA